MRGGAKRSAAVAGTITAVATITTLAVAPAGESAATYDRTKGTLRLCVDRGEAFIVAEGPQFVRVHGSPGASTSGLAESIPLKDGCAPDVQVIPGQYWVAAEKHQIAQCHIGVDSQECEGKVQHVHLFHSTNSPAATPIILTHETTFAAPDWTPAFLVADRLTQLVFHVAELTRPACEENQVCGVPAGAAPKDLEPRPGAQPKGEPRSKPEAKPKTVSRTTPDAEPPRKPRPR